MTSDTQLRSNLVVETDTETRGRGDAETRRKTNVLRMNATWYEIGILTLPHKGSHSQEFQWGIVTLAPARLSARRTSSRSPKV
jgi:hypothetical protein